ncbi:MAG: M1 family peptidase [Ignavibacteriae bacterium]|nr:MAG: M1 family peptidase [Ignavibacteriota bacterium]
MLFFISGIRRNFIRPFTILPVIAVVTVNASGQAAPYFQQSVSYDIKVSLDVDRHTLLGRETLTYINHSPDTLTFVWFHLYPNAYKDERSVFAREEEERGINDIFYTRESDRGFMTLDTIRTGTTDLRREYKDGDETEMKAFLPRGLAPGDSISFFMSFTVKIPRFISRLGHLNLHFEITQWYPKIAVYDNTGWHNDGYHVLGEFYGDYGTFQVAVTLPENMWVAATGILTDEKEKARLAEMLDYTKRLDHLSEKALNQQLDSLNSVNKHMEENFRAGNIPLKTISFVAEHVHDFAWACDFRFLVKKTEYANTSIYLFVLPENYTAWKRADQYAQDAVATMTGWVGDYIYPSLCVVNSFNPYGGMEYNNLVLCAVKDQRGFKFLEEVIFHEIGHQWFYGMLGNNEMADAWLDEGLTQFCELRYFKEKYNGSFNDSWFMKTLLGKESTTHKEMFKKQLQLISSYNPALSPASGKAFSYRSRQEFSNVYLRPAFALNMLKYSLGDSVFTASMRTYYRKNLLRHPSGESLISAFNETTRQDWHWFFDEWVYSNKQCNFKAGRLYSQRSAGNDYRTTFEVIRADSIVMPLLVEFKTEKDSLFRRQLFADKVINTIEFSSADRVVSAHIDPDTSLLEFNPKNNSTGWNGLHLSSLLPTESFYQNTIYVTPWLRHNSFSGWGYGGMGIVYDQLPFLFGNESCALGASTYYFPRTNTVDYAFVFRNTTRLFEEFNDYFLNYSKWQGEIKSEVGFEYRLGQYKFEHPSHNFLLRFSYDELFDARYYDPANVQEGKDVTVGIRYTAGLDHNLSTHQFDVEIRKSLNILDGKYDYTKITIEGYNDIPLSRRFSITNYTNAGMIHGTYPAQTGLFISPSGRTIYSDFGCFVGYRYFLDQAFSGGLAGYINENLSGRSLLSTRFDINVNLLNSPKGQIEPLFIKVFFEGAKLWRLKNNSQDDRFVFFDAGIGIKLIGVDLDLPLWKNYKVVHDGMNVSIHPDNRLAFNSILVRFDLTYYLQFALEMK